MPHYCDHANRMQLTLRTIEPTYECLILLHYNLIFDKESLTTLPTLSLA